MKAAALGHQQLAVEKLWGFASAVASPRQAARGNAQTEQQQCMPGRPEDGVPVQSQQQH